MTAIAAILIAAMALTACDLDTDDDNSGETPQTKSTDDGTGTGTGETPAADGDDVTATDDDDAMPETEDDVTAEATTDDATPTTDEPTPEATGDPATQDATDGAATSEGGLVFTASDAGEVELDWDGDGLALIEVRPNEGWDHSIDDEDGEEIEVDFRQENREVDLDAEIEDGRRHIELSDDWDDAEDGTYVVQEAGEVEFERDGDNLNLIEVRPNEGWDYTVDDEDDEEIEVEFRRDRDEAGFEAEVDDGELDIDIDTGRYPQDN